MKKDEAEFSRDFRFPGLTKSLLYGLADKCGLDVIVEGSGGEFNLSGDKEQVGTLSQEALYHCDFQISLKCNIRREKNSATPYGKMEGI